jgi:hypothetical protein
MKTLLCALFHRKHHYSHSGAVRGVFGGWELMGHCGCSKCGRKWLAI